MSGAGAGAGAGAALRNVLKRLAEPGARATRDPSGAYRIRGACGDEENEGQAFRFPAALADLLCRRDLIGRMVGTKDELILTSAGLAWLRRFGAPEDGFRVQHQLAGTRTLDADGAAATPVNAGESPLGWLARRKGANGQPFLAQVEVEAGETLRADFTYASLTPRVTQNWSMTMGIAGAAFRPDSDPRDAQLAAKARFLGALDAVGPGLSDVLIAICCHLQGMEDAERGLGWPVRSGKVVLKIALQRLAAHYRMGAAEGDRRTRSWRAAP